MEISPLMLARLLLYSFLWGMAVGVLYDLCKIVRVLLGERYSGLKLEKMYNLKLPFVKRKVPFSAATDKGVKKYLKAFVVFSGDLLCVLIAFCGLIVLNFAYNDGDFRFFTVAGLLSGFLIYKYTVGRIVIFVSEPAAFIIKYAFCAFFVILCYPIEKILKLVIKNIRKLYFLYSFTLEKRRKKVYNIKEKIYLLELAKNGFIEQKFFVSDKDRKNGHSSG